MGRRADNLTNRIRAAVERWLPWYNRAEDLRQQRMTRDVVLRAERVMNRTERLRGSYSRAGRRLARR